MLLVSPLFNDIKLFKCQGNFNLFKFWAHRLCMLVTSVIQIVIEYYYYVTQIVIWNLT